jgi:Flp pilus assembly pilin Flp
MKQNLLKLFLEDESGVTVIEIVLILVVLIGLVIIFKNQNKAVLFNRRIYL